MDYETGARSHLDRMNLTNRLCEMLQPVFDEHNVDFMEYGQNVLLRGNASFQSRLKKLDVKRSDVICMAKFAPDFLLHHRDSKTLCMADAKVSITPMFFDSAIMSLQYNSEVRDLDRHRIGEVEREAWDNYILRFPKRKVAIIMAAPYSPVLIHAEWATNLKGLHRYKGDLNTEADGSGTPHVNVDLAAMRPLSDFMKEEFGETIDKEMYGDILKEIRAWPLNKPGRVNWVQFNNVVVKLSRKCPWVRGRMPNNHERVKEYKRLFEELGLGFDVYRPTISA